MNPFRHLLKAAGAHPPVGTWITSASPVVAEAVGHAGFDWGVLDMEHAPADMMEVIHMLQAVSSTKMVPVVRVPWNDTVTIKRVLDAGATTLLIPLVQSADEARQAVAATRYPPQGVRGVAGMTRAARYGVVNNYLQHANDGMGVIVQLETPQALQQIDAIAAVEGVNALFIGPADLSAAMGYLGQLTHPAVLEQMSRAVKRAKEAGKPIGTIGGTPEVVAQYRAIGFDFVAISSDLSLLVRGAQLAISALRTQETSIVHSLTTGTHDY